MLPLLPEASVPHAPICSLALPAVLLLALCRKRPIVIHLRPLCRLLPYLCLAGISLMASPHRQAGWPGFGLLLAHLGGAVAAALCLNKKEQVARLLQFATVSGAVVAGIGIAQYYGGHLPGWTAPFYGRITATFANPNHLGGYLACLLPLSCVLAVGASHTASKAAWGLAAGCIYTALFLSASRGGWWAAILTLAGLGVGFWRAGMISRIKRARVVLEAVFGACCVVTLLYSFPSPLRAPHADALPQRLAQTGNLISPQVVGRTSLGHRRLIWKTAIDIVRDHPLIGTGYATYYRIYPAYRDRRLARDPVFQELAPAMRSENTRHAHNDYLQICAESGLPALLAFLFGLGPAFRLRLKRGSASGCDPLYHLGLWAILTALLLHGLVSYPLRLPLQGLFFWTALGLLLTAPVPLGRSHGPQPYPVRS